MNELAQAKGANVAGLHVVFTSYGIDFDDIDVFYLAGGFGRHLNVEASKRIGLVPSLDSAKIVQAGNTAIEGATIALLSQIEAPGIGRAGEESRALPPGNPPELLRFLRRGLPVQARGADSMRQVAEAIELARHAPRRGCAAGGVCAPARLSARLGTRRPGSGIGGLGAGLVCEERPALVLCAASGELRNQRRLPFEIDGVAFTSKRLQNTLQQAEAHSVILVAVGAGPEAEEESRRRWQEKSRTNISSSKYLLPRWSSIWSQPPGRACATGRNSRHGRVAALQPRVCRMGCCGAAAFARVDEADAQRALPFPRGSV